MDEADLAFDSEQQYLTQVLAAQRRAHPGLARAGRCHYCGNEDGIADRLFCDSDCAGRFRPGRSQRRRLGLPAHGHIVAFVGRIQPLGA